MALFSNFVAFEQKIQLNEVSRMRTECANIISTTTFTKITFVYGGGTIRCW